MKQSVPEPDPRSRFEDEGIPDHQEGTPGQQRAEDPQEMPLPAEDPVAVEDYGTTGEEAGTDEPLDGRLPRERPDPAAEGDPVAAAYTSEQSDTSTGGPPPEEDAIHVDE